MAEVILGMFFLALSNANVKFAARDFIWRYYTTAKTLPTTKRVECIDKKKFPKMALDKQSETFIVYMAAPKALPESAKMLTYFL